MKKGEFVQEKMVNWYQPKMLLSIAMKAVISGTFGNYADRRELEAALDTNLTENEEWIKLKEDYCNRKELWIDVINDTGDGFNSTFAIARSVAKSHLEFKCKDKDGQQKKLTTQRGRILLFGGDEVYPFPTRDAYENRFKVPFASALNGVEPDPKEIDRPHLYAIPGNHDWYDGLGNFIKVFCQQRKIGIWDTKQHRSYFALPLPFNYWIWAIDVQLNSDIDAPQLTYFMSIVNRMKEGDKVILVTAEPSWVYKEIHKKDISHERLEFFINEYIYNKDNCTGRNLKLAAVLTGDLHHYARYHNADNPGGRQYITAGGGGAFLHLTHNLPDILELKENNNLKKSKIFPDEDKSKKLLLGNFLFPVKNRFFTFLIGLIFIVSYWLFNDIEKQCFGNISYLAFSIKDAICCTAQMLAQCPAAIIFALILGGGFYAFTDVGGLKPNRARIVGIAHSLVQLFIFFLVTYAARFFEQGLYALGPANEIIDFILYAIGVFIICMIGGGLSSFLMGVYLYISNLFFNMHINEASSSVACPHYKNFLRLKIHEHGITIYPIGIKKVPKGWAKERNSETATYSFTGKEVETFLIENPIEINSSKLY